MSAILLLEYHQTSNNGREIRAFMFQLRNIKASEYTSRMGVTVHCRGAIDDPDRIEDLEDRLVDFPLDSGAKLQIWRPASGTDYSRQVRGVILNLVPGQDPTSLRLSPEGWLIQLTDIEDAEPGRLNEPPWCFVKIQFGSVDAHVQLVELLEARMEGNAHY